MARRSVIGLLSTLLLVATYLISTTQQHQLLDFAIADRIAGKLEFDPLKNYACDINCAMPITWDTPAQGCGQNNITYKNAMCNSTLATSLQCLVKNIAKPNPNIGISYPGVCGCPNECMSREGRGTCGGVEYSSEDYYSQIGHCTCNSGWTGDCSIVTEGNSCNGLGEVKKVKGFEVCVCEGDMALSDCSATIGPLPPINQTIVPVQQYSSWDDYGNNNPIFNDTTIAQIRLTMPAEFLEYEQNPDNSNTDTYLPVNMWFYNGAINETLDVVGWRIKGGASRNYVKKSFKLSFNKFVDGRKWYQQKKLELKAMQQDPSCLKEKLCLSMLYSMNAPAQRSAYTELFINEQFMGIYIMLEEIDDQYLQSRFDNDNGLLYKCVGDLAYLGPDPESYKNATLGETLLYEPKTPEAEDFTMFTEFITVINITSDSDFITRLPKIFDIDLYARTLAVEVLTGNWDGLWNGNNYYLYYNPDLLVFQYLRHDLEMSFGMFETFYPMSIQPVYTWGDGGRGYRLINRFLANEPFKGMFTQYCYELMDTYFTVNSSQAFVQRMEFLNAEIAPLVKIDLWRQVDFGWSYDEFLRFPNIGITRETGPNYVKAGYPIVRNMGLKPFMEVRISSALSQLDPRQPKKK